MMREHVSDLRFEQGAVQTTLVMLLSVRLK